MLLRTVAPSLLAGSAALLAASSAVPAQASLFGTQEVDASRFLMVAAPIGSGERYQLNIYEQRGDQRPCFAVSGANPGIVDPLLATFNFTGVCSRYIDGNGYSLRIGGSDFGTRYRLSVVRRGGDMQLLAVPSGGAATAEAVVARTGGQAPGFLQLQLEPGWKLMRRTYGDRALGHIYVYRDDWPAGAVEPPAGG
ncbi:DUF3747 domain-containing protein [Synechococcus sp. RSCCF101]|uniref:DUF3747 domain-containing protein n=1 Tax=Synechococcus sp. RSCCF101 TaxID=2511069 RepID=UPI001246A08E|nr:DUF3747 domain-containing protein [Synechococcus sp. RSCCF101]QEY32983.1 DUF3747 domain-containing protein [Synechococcus sp. RSCCF101]